MKDDLREGIKAAFDAEQADAPPPADLRRQVTTHPFQPGGPTMLRWKIVAAAASVVLAAAISGTLILTHLNASPAGRHKGQAPPIASTVSPSAPMSQSPAPSSTLHVSPGPTSAPLPAGGGGGSEPRCDVQNLRLTSGAVGAAAGNRAYDFVFTNISGGTCYLFGFPGMQMLDGSAGRLQPVPSRRAGNVFSDTTPHHVDLAPGGTASFTVGSVAPGVVPSGCPVSVWAEVTPPNSFNHVTIPASITVCAKPHEPYISPVVPGSNGDHA
jgi:uncharacterized protein DUF4232